MKKLLCALLCVMMVFCMMPSMAFAEEMTAAVDVSDNDGFKTALTADTAEIVINLKENVSYDINAWEQCAMGGASTTTITINGNGHTITFNKLNSDWNHVTTKNDAKLIINNAVLADSGHNNGPWNRYDINFACDVELNQVTSNKAFAFKADATLNDVTVNDSNDVYAIWIQPNGQTVEIDGLTVNATRGIKIDEQYVDSPATVTLTVDNATFDTVKKSAILVKCEAGANIVLGKNVDISGVDADDFYAVWVDDASAEHADKVTVTNGFKATEGQVPAVPSIGGGLLIDRMESDEEAGVYYEILNVPANVTVRAELYAGDQYLTYKQITVGTEGADELGCTFYTVGTSSSWKQDVWTAYDHIVPTHAVLYFDGIKAGQDTVEFTEEQWAAFPGTKAASIGGGLLADRTATADNEAAVYYEILNVPANTEVLVELYAGEQKLTYKKFKTVGAYPELGCSFYTVGTSSSWEQDTWTAYDHVVPTHAVLYFNGVEMGQDAVEFTAEQWAAFPGTKTASIGGGLLIDRMESDEEAGVYYEILNVPANVTVRAELYAGDQYLTYKQITVGAEGADELGCTFYTVGTSSSWEQDTWTAYDQVVPTHAVLYFNGVEMGQDTVEFTAEQWIPFPGTVAPTPTPPSGGGYVPTPTPTPTPTPGEGGEVVAPEEEDALSVNVKALLDELTPIARSEKTAKKNIKVTLKLDEADQAIIKQLEDAGYTVKYNFYRSTIKNAKYKSMLIKDTTTYTNTYGEKNTMYYYKARIQVYNAEGELIARTELKDCWYANRLWTK